MGLWELSDLTVAKHKIPHLMSHQSTGGPCDCVCVYHGSDQTHSMQHLLYQQLSCRSRTHVYQNTICKKAEWNNQSDTRQKLVFSQTDERRPGPNQQGEVQEGRLTPCTGVKIIRMRVLC